MKKLLTLFAFAATMLSFAACSSDDDDPSIVGTWKLTKMIEYASPSDKKGTEELAGTKTVIFTFKSDGTYTSVSSDTDYPGEDSRDSGTYVLKGGKIYIDNDKDNYGEYRFSGNNTLILTTYYDYDNYPEDGYKDESFWSRQ